MTRPESGKPDNAAEAKETKKTKESKETKETKDARKSNEFNEFIPKFISKKPFYLEGVDNKKSGENGSDEEKHDWLSHQRLQKRTQDSEWYDRGKKLGPAATKYRKGACENCGAMTHKKKDCLSRPRKAGAKFTGKNIEADEVIQEVQMGFDAKRDRWNGYDASNFKDVIEEYNAMEEIQEKAKLEAAEKGEDIDDGLKYDAETDMGRNQPTSTRNLRLREDTAKYLLSLDENSVEYDAKSRSLKPKEETLKGIQTKLEKGQDLDAAAKLWIEEGFQRKAGDAAEFEKAQRLAWEAEVRGDSDMLNLQANPSIREVEKQQQLKETEEQLKKAEEEAAAKKKALAEKYGTQEKFTDTSRKITVVRNQKPVTLDDWGGVIGDPKVEEKSRYPEDVLLNNHTSVWGSWWSNFQWGFACCHSTVKNSYCTGEAGKQAFELADRMRTGADLDEVPKEIAWKEEEALQEHVPNAPDKALKARQDASNRKRVLDEMIGGVNEEEMEEYRRKRTLAADPMAAYLTKTDKSEAV